MRIFLTTLFGLETLTRKDLEAAGYTKDQITVEDGRVILKVNDDNWEDDVARVNMWAGKAERVLFEVGEFKATNYDTYYEETGKLFWEDYIPSNYQIIVTGYSRKSTLYGTTAMQSLAKKAIVDRLNEVIGNPKGTPLNEDKNKGTIKITFAMVNDTCSMQIDTTGDGLHKRGYRPLTHEAPIRETLASAMVELARYTPFDKEFLKDPFCGSGTIVIEAARSALNIAPGIDRQFSYTTLPYIGKKPYQKAKEEAEDLIKQAPTEEIFFEGSDIDKKAVSDAKENAKRARVNTITHFEQKDALRGNPPDRRTLIITNPPYGGRLLTPKEAATIYKNISRIYLTKDGKCKQNVRLSVITPDDDFERATRLKADKRYKLYNGNKVCHLFNYYKTDKSQW